MSDYEPPAEMVEALRGEWNISGWMAGKVLRRQHERECGLLLAVAQLATLGGGHSDGNRIAQAALAAHAKLDAPKVPTVTEALKLAEASRFVDDAEPDVHIRKSAWDALKAAVEREEKERA